MELTTSGVHVDNFVGACDTFCFLCTFVGYRERRSGM